MSPAQRLALFLSETPQEIRKFQIELRAKLAQHCKEQRKPDPLWQTLAFERQGGEELPRNFVQHF
jgi:hypothetical protein